MRTEFTLGKAGLRKTGSSEECFWEPGSAMVPTFCELVCASRRHSELSGNASDGDLPLAGDGGGLPNKESLSLIVASARLAVAVCSVEYEKKWRVGVCF